MGDESKRERGRGDGEKRRIGNAEGWSKRGK